MPGVRRGAPSHTGRRDEHPSEPHRRSMPWVCWGRSTRPRRWPGFRHRRPLVGCWRGQAEATARAQPSAVLISMAPLRRLRVTRAGHNLREACGAQTWTCQATSLQDGREGGAAPVCWLRFRRAGVRSPIQGRISARPCPICGETASATHAGHHVSPLRCGGENEKRRPSSGPPAAQFQVVRRGPRAYRDRAIARQGPETQGKRVADARRAADSRWQWTLATAHRHRTSHHLRRSVSRAVLDRAGCCAHPGGHVDDEAAVYGLPPLAKVRRRTRAVRSACLRGNERADLRLGKVLVVNPPTSNRGHRNVDHFGDLFVGHPSGAMGGVWDFLRALVSRAVSVGLLSLCGVEPREVLAPRVEHHSRVRLPGPPPRDRCLASAATVSPGTRSHSCCGVRKLGPLTGCAFRSTPQAHRAGSARAVRA